MEGAETVLVTAEESEKIPVSSEKIWDSLSDFSSYSFNKSHSVSYSIIAYMTARIWTYHRDELLQYEMNFGGKDRLNKAVKLCRDLGMDVVFPDWKHLSGDMWKVEEGKVIVPGYGEKDWESFSAFLFGAETSKITHIFRGAADQQCVDREGLANLVKALPNHQVLGFPNCDTMQEVLENGRLAQLWTYEDNGTRWLVHVQKKRSTKDVVIQKVRNADTIQTAIQKDFQAFGAVRSGLLVSFPNPQMVEIYQERFPQLVQHALHQAQEKSDNGPYQLDVRKTAQQQLQNQMKRWLWDHENKMKRYLDQQYRVILLDMKKFDRYMKVTLLFEDGEHLFYVRDASLMRELMLHSKKDVLDVHLQFDPYVSKNLEFVPMWKLKDLCPQEQVELGVPEEL